MGGRALGKKAHSLKTQFAVDLHFALDPWEHKRELMLLSDPLQGWSLHQGSLGKLLCGVLPDGVGWRRVESRLGTASWEPSADHCSRCHSRLSPPAGRAPGTRHRNCQAPVGAEQSSLFQLVCTKGRISQSGTLISCVS